MNTMIDDLMMKYLYIVLTYYYEFLEGYLFVNLFIDLLSIVILYILEIVVKR